MKANARTLCLWGGLALLIAFLMGCGRADNPRADNPRVTRENLAKIKQGMSLLQVEAILAKSDKQSTEGVDLGEVWLLPVAGAVVHVWESGDKKIAVLFNAGIPGYSGDTNRY